MPDRRRHRGAHPDDARLFAPGAVPALRRAVDELSWLLSHGYAEESALALVGNRHDLTQRQRMAVRRSACSDASLARRASTRQPVEAMRGAEIALDGYNVLITVESALAGGLVLIGRDGCARDLASIHGTYRRVDETTPALEAILLILAALRPSRVSWMLDRPVSNSGRLRGLIEQAAHEIDLAVDVRLHDRTDATLTEFRGLVATSDSWILDRADTWVNLAMYVVQERCGSVRLVDLRTSPDCD